MWSAYIKRHSVVSPFAFSHLIAYQNEILLNLKRTGGSALIFAELPSTITLGARQVHHEPETFTRLQHAGVEVVPGERGGNETWHGPGQWVCFVLTPLQEYVGDPRGVRKAVHHTLDLVLPVVRKFKKSAKIEYDDRLGIWGDLGKIVSIGIKIKEGYSSSGFAINCIPNEQAFLRMNPCGIEGARPEFLFEGVIEPNEYERAFVSLPRELLTAFRFVG